jgi:hypothetical protein
MGARSAERALRRVCVFSYTRRAADEYIRRARSGARSEGCAPELRSARLSYHPARAHSGAIARQSSKVCPN